MRSPFTKGFTLIELLVVIAIIGVLSSIVLSSLNTARNKGNDAAIKSNLDQARTQAELFYDANGNHYVTAAGGATDVCAINALANGQTGVYKSVEAAAQSAGISDSNIRTNVFSSIDSGPSFTKATCHSCYAGEGSTNCTPTSQSWAVEVPLKSNNTLEWCVDSNGFVGTTTTSLGNGDAKCG